MPVVAISNQKGGVGKTTTTLNLGAALREQGKRVLLVDLDPQGNLSVAAGIEDVDSQYPTIGDLLMVAARGKPVKGMGIEDAIIPAPVGMDVVPSNGTLSAAELGLVSAMNREAALAGVLKPVLDRYDYILIDCLPSLGLLAINALRASDGVVIPVQTDFLAMQGLAQIFETIAAVREQLNPPLAIYGVLLTMVDPRTTHSREVVLTVRQSLQGEVQVFDTEIRMAVVLKETARVGRSVIDFDSTSSAAAAYRALARELIEAVGDVPASDVAIQPSRRTATRAAQQEREEPVHGVLAEAEEVAASYESTSTSDAEAEVSTPTPDLVLPTMEADTSTAVPERLPEPTEAEEPQTSVNGSAETNGLIEPARFEQFLKGREAWLGTKSQ